MSKPLVIQLREAKENILESINTAIRDGVPCFLLEPIIAEIHTQTTKAAQDEYDRALKLVADEEAKKLLAAQEVAEERGADNG